VLAAEVSLRGLRAHLERLLPRAGGAALVGRDPEPVLAVGDALAPAALRDLGPLDQPAVRELPGGALAALEPLVSGHAARGGLDGYAEAFTALRKISGVVPSIMCMFGFNAGGGSYLPRQGSFMIQPNDTFFGLTGPGVVKSVLGEDVSPDELGGPRVHGASGVTDVCVTDEVAALRVARRLLSYLPSSNKVMAPYLPTGDPIERRTTEIDALLRKSFNSPTGFNTPLDVSIIV
jgi:hypothetical protein